MEDSMVDVHIKEKAIEEAWANISVGWDVACPVCGRELKEIPVKDRLNEKGQRIWMVYRCTRCKCDRAVIVGGQRR